MGNQPDQSVGKQRGGGARPWVGAVQQLFCVVGSNQPIRQIGLKRRKSASRGGEGRAPPPRCAVRGSRLRIRSTCASSRWVVWFWPLPSFCPPAWRRAIAIRGGRGGYPRPPGSTFRAWRGGIGAWWNGSAIGPIRTPPSRSAMFLAGGAGHSPLVDLQRLGMRGPRRGLSGHCHGPPRTDGDRGGARALGALGR